MKVIGALAFALAAVTAVASCGDSDKESSGPNGLEKSQLTVGVLPIADAAAVPLANTRGFFKQEGLTIKLETVQGGAPATSKLLAGGLDVSQTNYVSLFLAREKGNKVKVIADAAQAKPNLFNLMVTNDSTIKSPGDLKGKRIAVNTLRNIGELAVTSTLKVNGVEAKDVKFVEYPFPNMGPALQKGDVDAAWLTEPFISSRQSKVGLRSLADTMTGPTTGLPIAGWQVTEKFARENPKTVAAFRRAVLRAQRLASENRRAVQDVITTYTPIDRTTAQIITLPDYPTSLNAQRIQRIPDLMQRFGYLKGKTDARTALEGASG